MSGDEDLRTRVRQVIASSGLTQTAFAQAIEMEPTKLSKALTGTRRFTPLELALIAEQGETSTDWLLNGSSTRPALAARSEHVTVADAAQAACAKAEDLDEIYETLADLGRYGQPPALPRFRPHGLLINQGEALAAESLRFLATLGAGQHADDLGALPDTIERVFGINIVIEDLGRGFDGLAWCRNGFRLILVSNATSWTRQRFSIAHELGHVLAGDAQDLQIDIDVMAPSVKHADTERRANAFAASFLMPTEAINAVASMNDDTFARLVGQFGVSPSALSWRLLNLGRIDDREQRRLGGLALWECAERGGWLDRYRALTRDQSEVRRPGLLSREVLGAFEDGDVSARVAARVLDIPPETLLPPAPPAQRSNGLDDDLAFAP